MAENVAQFASDPGNVMPMVVRNGSTVTAGQGVVFTATGIIPVTDGSVCDGIAHDTVTGTAIPLNSICDVWVGKYFRFTPSAGYLAGVPAEMDRIVPASGTTWDLGTAGDTTSAVVVRDPATGTVAADANGRFLAVLTPNFVVPTVV
jgi:hypothetical protein